MTTTQQLTALAKAEQDINSVVALYEGDADINEAWARAGQSLYALRSRIIKGQMGRPLTLQEMIDVACQVIEAGPGLRSAPTTPNQKQKSYDEN